MSFLRIFLLLLLADFVHAQNVFKVDFKFGLYDERYQFVKFDDFCKSYQIYSEELKSELSPCTNTDILKKDFFNKKKKSYSVQGNMLYEDVIRFFVNGTDTMQLVLLTKGGGKDMLFQMDSLQIIKGKYVVAEQKLGHLDLKAAEAGYYNWVLNKFKSLGELTKNYEGSIYFVELNRLRLKYKLQGDDYKEKTYAELYKPKPQKTK